MAYLAFSESEAITRGNRENERYARELQEKVLAEHVRPFAFALGERIHETAKTDFYRAMGDLLVQLFRP